MDIELIPLLQDNYGYLLIDGSGKVAIVDPGEAEPVQAVLQDKGLKLDYILNTHHHGDHIAGNAKLKELYDCEIVGPASEVARISLMDTGLKEGDVFRLGNSEAQIIETPGHTIGHICFYFAQDNALFCGDTLFSMGCGRLFEGSAEQMWSSLTKIKALPDETKLYCGHEYTLSNAAFCLEVEPENEAIKEKAETVRELRAKSRPTIPSTLGEEKETNAFLRANSAEHFGALRALKDNS